MIKYCSVFFLKKAVRLGLWVCDFKGPVRSQTLKNYGSPNSFPCMLLGILGFFGGGGGRIVGKSPLTYMFHLCQSQELVRFSAMSMTTCKTLFLKWYLKKMFHHLSMREPKGTHGLNQQLIFSLRLQMTSFPLVGQTFWARITMKSRFQLCLGKSALSMTKFCLFLSLVCCL